MRQTSVEHLGQENERGVGDYISSNLQLFTTFAGAYILGFINRQQV